MDTVVDYDDGGGDEKENELNKTKEERNSN
jgi:hypothetical protein